MHVMYDLLLRLTDAAVVSRDGSIFFTDASYKYSLEDHILDVIEGRPHGRLLKYDPKTRSTITLLDNLYFANGVALSSNEDFLVFCETTMYTLALFLQHEFGITFAFLFIVLFDGFAYEVCGICFLILLGKGSVPTLLVKG